MDNPRQKHWQDQTDNAYHDNYQEINSKSTYWDHMSSKAPYGRNAWGEPNESPRANPDILEESFEEGETQPSGPRIILNEALALLTARQMKIWNLYYKDDFTEEEIAEQLGIVHSTVSRSLKASLKKVSEYCETNKFRLGGDNECGEIG